MGQTATKEAKDKLKSIETSVEKGQEKVAEKLSKTADALHEKADNVQEFLTDKTVGAEDSLRQKTYEASDAAQQTLEKANKLGHKTADAIERSSEYVRDFDAREARDKAIKAMKNRPQLMLTAAGLIGIAIGYLVGRRRG